MHPNNEWRSIFPSGFQTGYSDYDWTQIPVGLYLDTRST